MEKELIGKILRIYDGTFYKQVKIDEEYLAEKLGITLEELGGALNHLHHTKVIQYEKGGDTPKVKIRGPRLHSEKIKISEALYTERKAKAFERLDGLQVYLESTKCRQAEIDHYFDFEVVDDCGICDRCKLKNGGESDQLLIENKVLALLKKEINTLEGLIEKFDESERKELISVLERMESDKVISIVSNNVILER